MKKETIYTIIGIGLFVVSGIIYQVYHDALLEKNGIYTIITLEKIKGGGRGCEINIYYSYPYKNIKHEEWGDCFSRTMVSEKDIGHRFFMKFTPDINGNTKGYIDLLFHCSVPDTLQVSPDGWSQEWMKEHFPDCVKNE